MIEHYNAFISYKHAPLDTKVASEIQTRLERFRIPKAIQKSSGIKKIDRIFRDKEELLITSDLNETIEHALVNSDFLIVICSYSTKESVWVQREIEFFLKTHSKNQVLTVVAEGEPVDVVPQILQERQVTVTLDDGSEETGLNSSKFLPKAGISGRPSRSKSIASPNEFFPRASFIHAYTIWNITLSSSNLISVLVGWILTSTPSGSMSRYMKYEGVTPSGIRFSYAFITALCR